jgi:hypothetical protein
LLPSKRTPQREVDATSGRQRMFALRQLQNTVKRQAL